MGNARFGRVVLLSVRPVFASAILAGVKRVEFRKRPLAADVTHALVYATRPSAQLVGAFAVAGQVTATPDELWDRFAHFGGIERDQFVSYFAGHRAGTGIVVGEVFVASVPLSLSGSVGLVRPPQSSQYVDPQVAAPVIASMVPAVFPPLRVGGCVDVAAGPGTMPNVDRPGVQGGQ